MENPMTRFKREFEMPWEVRPWWFNWFVAGPASLVFLLFLPVGYIFVPPFRRGLNAILADQESTYARLHETHKSDPLTPPNQSIR